MIYLTLFYEFFKTGLFAVGGGLATIPFLFDMANKYPWLTPAQLADMIAVAESTPGPVGINCATYAGYNAAGVPGAFVSTFSIVLPSFIIISIIARAMARFKDSPILADAFSGLRPAASGLIANAAWSVMASVLFSFAAFSEGGILSIFNVGELVLFAVLIILTNLKPLRDLHPLVFIVLAAAAGIIFSM